MSRPKISRFNRIYQWKWFCDESILRYTDLQSTMNGLSTGKINSPIFKRKRKIKILLPNKDQYVSNVKEGKKSMILDF
jgi:hypothetical protein